MAEDRRAQWVLLSDPAMIQAIRNNSWSHFADDSHCDILRVSCPVVLSLRVGMSARLAEATVRHAIENGSSLPRVVVPSDPWELV